MLVLTRRIGEGITVGADIRIVVVEIKGGQVRLGIEAPISVQVHRDEVHARIIEENRHAAGTTVTSLKVLMAERPSRKDADED